MRDREKERSGILRKGESVREGEHIVTSLLPEGLTNVTQQVMRVYV